MTRGVAPDMLALPLNETENKMHSLQTISRLNEQEYEAHKAAVARAQAQAARDEAQLLAAKAQSAEKVAKANAARNAAVLKHAGNVAA